LYRPLGMEPGRAVAEAHLGAPFPRDFCRVPDLISFSISSEEKLERSTRLIPVRRNSRFGLSDGTEAAPITGAPAAHCLYVPHIASRSIRLVAGYIMGTTRLSIGH